MSSRLAERIALITGGTSGIGLATARLFAAEGATVVVTGATERSVAEATRSLAGIAEVIRSDAGDAAQVRELFSYLGRRYDGLDVLFLNAGIFKLGMIAEMDMATFDEVFRVNVGGVWLALAAATPLLRRGGAVILNASVAHTKGPGAGLAAYAASKAAVRSLGRTAAAELLPRGVRVNVISPGPVETPLFGKLGFSPDAEGRLMQALRDATPLRRFATAEEMARSVLFLATDESSYMVGADLAVDGGGAQL